MLRLLVAMLVLGSIAPAQTSTKVNRDGAILSRNPVSLPSFDAIQDIAKYATPAEYSAAVADKAFVYERLEYASDGLTVSAYLYRPAKINGKYPTIIFNRGNYVARDQGPALLTMFRRLGKEGFVVVAPMLRGSDGTAGKDEMGGNDLHDIANVFALLNQLGLSEMDNVFMYGESRGGIMTLLAIKAGMPIKAAATFGAITDMGDYLNKNQRDAGAVNMIWPDFEQNKQEILRSRSAQEWADAINVPILLMHGAKDPQVPPVQTLQLAEKLSADGKNFGVIVYPGDNHILAHNRVKRDQQVTEWFQSFISEAKPQ